MRAFLKVLDYLWSIKFIKGHRTEVAMWGLKIAAGVLSYQTLATSSDLIAAGVNLPDLPANVLLWLSPLPAYFAGMVERFAKEHV